MDVKELNMKMVESFLDKFKRMNLDLPDKNVVDAFLNVYRHYFTPYVYKEKNGILNKYELNYTFLKDELLNEIYVDIPLVVLADGEKVISTSSQPFVMAMMIRDAKVSYGGKILEIGTGSGYNAAILAYISKKEENIVTIEIDKRVSEFAIENLKRANFTKVRVINADGGMGYPKESPFDSIIATCGCPEIPFFDQLKDGGYLSIPLVTRGIETLVSFRKDREKLVGKMTLFVKFLHFEGIFSDKKQFSKNIASLKRIVETYCKIRDDLKNELSEIIEKDDDDEKIIFEKRQKRANFNLYLAISENYAIMYESDVKGRENGYGLWNTNLKDPENGLILVFPKEIISWGSEKLVERYLNSYKKWKDLGMLKLDDYTIEYYPDINKKIENEEKIFTVDRRYGKTLFKID